MAQVPLPTPTDNDVPSTDIRDAVYAGAMLDKVVTSTDLTYTDRLGGEHYTVDGMKAEGDKVVEETRKNLIPLSRQYMTLAAAQADIANIPEGSTTYYRSPDDSALAIEVINNGGTLVDTGRLMPSVETIDEKIDAKLTPGDYAPSMVPLFHDSEGYVPLWLVNSLLDAAGLGPQLSDTVSKIPNELVSKMINQLDYNTSFFPLIYDEDGNVPLWMDNGKVDAAGFGPNLQSIVSAAGGADSKYIEGDIFKFLFKKGQVFNSVASSVNVAFTGDSWTEKNTIPKSLISVLGGTYKDPGWISTSTRPDAVMAGITLTSTGFTIYDGDNEHNNAPPTYGCGPDGNAMYNTGSVATMTWSGVKATDLTLFYYDGTGSFNLIVDGTTVATIAGTNTGQGKKYDLSGLTSASHTVRITTIGNGVVSIFGMYGKDTGVASGVTISRMGNGASTAGDYLNWSNWIKPTAQYLDIDLLFIILGTNDFRKSKGLDQYREGITEIITQYQQAIPGVCICLISPAQSNATGVPALSDYDNEMRNIAIETNSSYISGYKIFPKTYNNSNGAWEDTLHLSNLGAFVLTKSIKNNFFEE
ncbi:SGNH/GDSL hydrolase family protein [Klebsiella michiganensis]|uniref:SGNH/GDSL hydrolase family protein n=1 Tax=Klebsiella michiganensis TaxID=1134687 RepID=UPI002DB68FEF|nr:GDSL-type esterase/lipase family protein [Klebsiella michiganensis]MEB8293117.1 SGNH/GDSL hydrolase family protein [Klebsiella michiganensis]